jgi:RNA polymerase sigma-70 factor (ECF subfamily)
MDPSSQGGGFRTTRWSLVLDASADPVALDELLRLYWGPIYAYIRRSGRARETAADLTQEFIAQRIVAGALLDRADPVRGRFRTFVKAALRNFLIDQDRRRRAQCRAPQHGVLLHGYSLDDIEPREGDDPGSAFDRQWAATMLSNAISRVHADCIAEGQVAHWNVFERSVVQPALGRMAPIGLAELAGELGEASPERISAMIQTVRRKFRRVLRALIEETVADPALADDEASVLKEFLKL